jgi:hypothetical protein
MVSRWTKCFVLSWSRESPFEIWADGQLMQDVQLSQIFPDSKVSQVSMRRLDRLMVRLLRINLRMELGMLLLRRSRHWVIILL